MTRLCRSALDRVQGSASVCLLVRALGARGGHAGGTRGVAHGARQRLGGEGRLDVAEQHELHGTQRRSLGR